MVARIPIAHIHGGEATEGLIDEPIRHAITKLSQFHFVAAEPYRERVIQMGESPTCVWNYGAPGLDNFKRLDLLNKEDFEKAINFDLGELSFLVTYHPVTLSRKNPQRPFSQLLSAVEQFKKAKIIFTKSNSDTDGRIINKLIEQYADNHKENSKVYTSMGQLLYLSALNRVNAVIGNSSSGIVEAPCVPVPTVNIGDRQKGRLKAISVIDCPENREDIINAIKKAISDQFRESISRTISLYGQGDASIKIKEKLKEVSLNDVVMKRFYNIKRSK
jgi:UDP-N-acetylglucosamine 2-epimerase (non-hydrolysing)/GDP/UDP-N,N'-diacetylbacillosamine 2-epimerase (hydrolysing)